METMKCLILFLVFNNLLLSAIAYPKVTVYQHCGQKELTFYYKSGDGSKGVKINDSTSVFEAPIDQPVELSILIGEDNQHMKMVWLAPGYKDRTVTIDHCTGRFIKHDTLSFDIDDAPYAKIYNELIDGKISEDTYSRGLSAFMESYVQAHPDSFLAVHYLKSIAKDITLDKLIEYRDRVKVYNAKYADMSEIESYIKNYKYKSTTHIGDPFFEFQAIGLNGKPFDSRSISDRVIVLYFCYSGCGPCSRVAEPLRKVYEKYKPNGLEIVSISLDNKEEDWQKSVAAHHYPGINVSDLVGFNSPLAMHYAVTAFPFFVVFDRTKKIAMVTFGADEVPLIEGKVQELSIK
jgi:thiol-disulfide isomerase/thioredoxin